ncbi:hypothetical protein Syun_022548 [Stephania yunnanensis]|uniref:Uncharacterized protein n=1 Tax=Stephania yunnanensis TaxID=152371 RepID=A0AAP0F9V1_9MAGN
MSALKWKELGEVGLTYDLNLASGTIAALAVSRSPVATAAPAVPPHRLTRAVGGQPVTLFLQLSLASRYRAASPLSLVERRQSSELHSALRDIAPSQDGRSGVAPLARSYGPTLVITKDAGNAITLFQSLADSTFDNNQLVLTACMGYQAVSNARLRESRHKHRPLVRSVIEERSKGLNAWKDTQGLASKL